MPRRRASVLAVIAIGLLVGIPVGVQFFFDGQAPVRIGSHVATASPTVDGQATLVVGGLVPSLRVDAGLPLGVGVKVTVVDTEATSPDVMVQRDALIASAPEGEVARVRQAIERLALASVLRGAAAGALAALVVMLLWALPGPARRAELADRLRRTPRWPGVRGALLHQSAPWWGAAIVTVALAVAAVVVAPRAVDTDETWTSIGELVPEAGLDAELARIEVADGTTTSGGVNLIRGAISTYRESITYYDDLTARVGAVAEEFRTPAEDEVVALMVSDRHDNIGMDRVARAVGDAAGASVLLDAGDDTASGASWEDFSIDSLATAFDGYSIVAVTGNHDAGGEVAEMMADADFTVLDGEPAEVAGIDFLGAGDPRSSGFGSEVAEGEVGFDEAAKDLARTACEEARVSTVLVHSPSMGLPAAETGCVDLVLSGHVHRQIGPDLLTSGQDLTTTFSNGTTGGAAYAFALGSALRRPAQLTVVTFLDGRPSGLQPVDIATDGAITVQRYQPLELSAQAAQGRL